MNEITYPYTEVNHANQTGEKDRFMDMCVQFW